MEETQVLMGEEACTGLLTWQRQGLKPVLQLDKLLPNHLTNFLTVRWRQQRWLHQRPRSQLPIAGPTADG